MDIFYPKRGQKEAFLTTYPPHLVHVVFELPLRVKLSSIYLFGLIRLSLKKRNKSRITLELKLKSSTLALLNLKGDPIAKQKILF